MTTTLYLIEGSDYEATTFDSLWYEEKSAQKRLDHLATSMDAYATAWSWTKTEVATDDDAPGGREVWGYQVGTWPPVRVQSEEIARSQVSYPGTGKIGGSTYPVKLVRGTAFNTVWEVVE